MTSGLALLALFLKVLLFVVVVLFFSTTQFVTAVPRVRLRHGERIDVLAKQTMDLKYVLVDEEYKETETRATQTTKSCIRRRECLRNMERETRYCGGTLRERKEHLLRMLLLLVRRDGEER
jgi:hypothetical protein